MDWSKVKSILIFVFISLNIFLFTLSLNAKEGKSVSASVVRDTEKILSLKGVKLDCKIPLYDKQTGNAAGVDYSIDKSKVFKELIRNDQTEYDNFEYDKEYSYGNRSITFLNDSKFIYNNKYSEGSNSVNLYTVSQTEKHVRSLFDKMGISMENFVLDDSSSSDDGNMSLKFIEEYDDGIDVFDSYIYVNVSKSIVSNIQCSIRKISEQEESSTDIVAAYQILLKNYYENGTIIKAVDFGFKVGIDEIDPKRSEYLPVWRVRKSDESERYFNAYTGDEIQK